MASAEGGENAVQHELQEYLGKHGVNQLFISIVEQLLIEKPDNPIGFIVTYLQNKYPVECGPTKAESKTVEEYLHRESDSEDDSDEDEDDYDAEAELPVSAAPASNTTKRGRRISVSASVMAAGMRTGPPPVFEKSEEEANHLKQVLRQNILCSHLEFKDMEILVAAMEKAEVQSGDEIITQGEVDAKYYFVLDSGKAEVLKNGEVLPVVYEAGAGFGELALMYNAPRAATVRALEPCTVWRLERECFKSILVAQTTKKRELYVQFLKDVPLLKHCTDYELFTLADALEGKFYMAGDKIVTEGEEGHTFYIIKQGEVDVWHPGDTERIGHLMPGQFFGEMALLTNQPRAASVIATEEPIAGHPEGASVELLCVDRKVFQRVLGPVTDILKRHMVTYNQVMHGKGHV